MLRYVLDQSRDCIKILGPEGSIDYINSGARCALEIADINAVLGKAWPELWPAEARPLVNDALRKAQAGQSSVIEASRPGLDDDSRWWQASVSPLMDDDTSLAGVLIISRDVTEDVRLREAEQTLSLEMRHRLRNAYTIASAVVMQSAAGDRSVGKFASTVCGRLADVALSQTRLLEAGEKNWAVGELIATLVDAHGKGATGIHFTGPANVTVGGQEAMLIALVIGELTNNSLKYGALRQGEATSLSWSIDGGQLSLLWREKVIGKNLGALSPRDAGSGYSMMQRMARTQRAQFSHSIVDHELRVALKMDRRH